VVFWGAVEACNGFQLTIDKAHAVAWFAPEVFAVLSGPMFDFTLLTDSLVLNERNSILFSFARGDIKSQFPKSIFTHVESKHQGELLI
jgi:hypothetical protein